MSSCQSSIKPPDGHMDVRLIFQVPLFRATSSRGNSYLIGGYLQVEYLDYAGINQVHGRTHLF